MIQPIRRQARMPLLALVAVALATLVSISLARITTSSAARSEAAIPTIVRTDVSVQRPVVQAPTDKASCSSATYVSGDLPGDTSPTEVYATMCAKP